MSDLIYIEDETTGGFLMLVPQDEELESIPKTEPIKQGNPKLTIENPSGTLFSKPVTVNTRPVTSKSKATGISNQIFSSPSSQTTKLKEDIRLKEDLKPKEEPDTKSIVDNFSKLLSKYDPEQAKLIISQLQKEITKK
eukprot:CAMPEP_0176424390 /NCGR_PEP_ID=MMETSP0127-20121128/10812_1 /TAXON_ID=938130 /ORGANISM="Platyophrya macrostoma, Strain WH" /LENGTH=137 /DNA_ID=CAMNT_0017805445 /DNA_START=26 /DNA_END=442 /DNA_ORIENTATION=-